MHAHEIMTRELITVRPETPVQEAVRLMIAHRISGLPVVSEGRLVGIVSERDFVRRAEIGTARPYIGWLDYLMGVEKAAVDFVKENGRRVEDVMTRGELFTVDEDAPLDQVAELMLRENVRRVPVVRGEALVGIVTRMDLLQAFASVERNVSGLACKDDSVRDQVISSIQDYAWRPRRLQVKVRDGVVDLCGTIIDDQQRRAVIIAAENVPGVVMVRDQLRLV